ncbi:MAG TPA: nuclear transport factor 2 family protein [Longimicrobium sp.]|nr:nuclear transport factor 2 family protein [Longimicrobium sp.]
MRRYGVRLLPLMLVLAVLPARLAAQDTPERVVQRYYEAIKAGDYAATAAMMHPEALDQIKTMFTSMAAAFADQDPDEMEQFLGVRTAADLEKLPAQEVFARMLKSTVGAQEELRQVLATAEVTVLGSVPEGETSHVLYRNKMSMMGMEMNQVQVASVKRHEGQWKVLLTADLSGMMGALGGLTGGGDEP